MSSYVELMLQLVWNLSGEDTGSLPKEELCQLANTNGNITIGDIINGEACCKYFECKLWFDLVKSMWKNYHSVFDDHLRHFMNNIRKF